MAAGRAALALILLAAFALCAAAGAASSRRGSAVARCNPKDDVCHSCERICSTRRGDKTLTLNTACMSECEVAIYNCDEGNPTDKGENAACVEGALRAIIEEHGDLSTKLIYDVPPSFQELDELKQEDGCIRKEDVKVLVDILDGSSEAGVTMPTAKADVWAMWAKADTNKDGCVDRNEFAAASMGPEFEKDMPVPHHDTVDEAAVKSIKNAGNAAADAVDKGAKSTADAVGKGAKSAADAAGTDDMAEDSPVYIPYAEDGSDAAPAEATPAEAAPAEEAPVEAAPAEPEESGDGVMEDAAEASPVAIPYTDGDEEAAPAEAAPAEAAPAEAAPAEAAPVEEAPAEAAPAEPEVSGDGVVEDAAEASPVAIPYMDGDEEAAPAEAAAAEAAPAEAAAAQVAPAEEDAGAAGDGIMEDMVEDSPVAIPYAEAQQTSLHRPHRAAPQRRLRSFRRAL